jgi:tetratricopeptide (TPR) repeat protein
MTEGRASARPHFFFSRAKFGTRGSTSLRGLQPFFEPPSAIMRAASLGLLITFAVAGCDRMVTPRHTQQLKDADAKAAGGDFIRAISLYESALEDRPTDADVHYKLGLLYDDKMNYPLDALHHFKRYLAIAPNGPHAADVKNFIKRDEVVLLTSLSGDAIISRAEATRLRNENLTLRKDLDEARGRSRLVSSGQPSDSTKAKTSDGKKRTYVVQRGDTLASISRRFYKSSAHWKRILDANRDIIDNPKKLTVGQTLVIPSR